MTCIYNQSPDLFSECIRSVEQQKYASEWIIVDDGSDVRHKQIFKQLLTPLRKSFSITFIELPQNMGLSYARNIGIKQACGEWLVVLDSDDFLAPSLTKNIQSLPKQASLVCFGVEFFKNNHIEYRNVKTWEKLYKQFGLTVADPFLWFDFYYHGIMARRNLLLNIGGYNFNLKMGEDQDILLRACEEIKIQNVFFINEVGYHYRDNPKGICTIHWPIVEKNYCQTMLAASNRRGANFESCKFNNTTHIDGVDIETYIYKFDNSWLTWHEYLHAFH